MYKVTCPPPRIKLLGKKIKWERREGEGKRKREGKKEEEKGKRRGKKGKGMDEEGKGKGRGIRREREEGSEREENRKGRVKGKLKNGRVVKKIKVVLTLHNPVKGTMKKSQSHLVLMEGRIDGQINQLRMVPNIFEKKRNMRCNVAMYHCVSIISYLHDSS